MASLHDLLRKLNLRVSCMTGGDNPVVEGTYPDDVDEFELGHDTIPNLVKTPTIRSIRSGDWSDADTWDLARIPQDDDIVGIQNPHVVHYDVDSTERILGVGVNGTLKFVRDADTALYVSNLFVFEDGWLDIGTADRLGVPDDPVLADAEVVFLDIDELDTDTDPQQYGHGLVMMGRITVCGAPKTPFVRVDTEPEETDTAITFGSAVTGWEAGDRLYVPDTLQRYTATLGGSFSPQWEYPVIASMGGGNTSANLTAGLDFDHFGARDHDSTLVRKPHVANLTRNVVFRSENHNGVRGHAIFADHHVDIVICYCAFEGMGRTTIEALDNTTFDGGGSVTHVGTNQIGRYAIHIHHVLGPEGLDAEEPQFTIVGVAVTDNSTANNQRWAIALHDSHWGLVKYCVCEHYGGWGIGLEEGNEINNVIDSNFVCRIVAPDPFRRIDQGDERGVHGRGYYLSSPVNTVTNNIACNIGDYENNGAEYAYGFTFFNHQTNAVATFMSCPTTKGGHTYANRDLRGEVFPAFTGNEVYGGPRGMEVWFYNSGVAGAHSTTESLIELSIWHVHFMGVFMYYNGYLTLTVQAYDDVARMAQAPACIYHADYFCEYLTLDDCDIHHFGQGYVATSESVGPQVIQNSHFACTQGINVGHLWQSGGSAETRQPRYVECHNCTFEAPSGYSLIAILCELPDPAASTGAIINWVQLNECRVYDYQGTPGDDFRIWFDEQDEDVITPQTTVNPGNPLWNIWQGATAAGQTNQENWDDEEISMCGSVRPTSGLESRTGIPQQVTVI